MSEQKAYVDLSKARTPDQHAQMSQIIEDGVCPFCTEHLATYHTEPIVDENDSWVVTNNMHLYDFSARHLLLIAKRHIEHIRELSVEEWADLGQLVTAQVTEVPYGALAARFGDMTHTAASVSHLHFHIIEPVAEMPEGEKLKFKVSR